MPRVLVVDDDPSIRLLLSRLMELESYECVVAASAEEARRELERGAFEMVLLDVMMPGESGMKLLEDVRTNYAETAVIMVTGLDDTELAKTAIEFGAYGYMIKPFNPSEVVINVANALHRRKLDLEHLRSLQQLQAAVEERTRAIDEASRQLEQATGALRSFKEETVLRLARTVELRDEETGKHLHRMSMLSELLARSLGLLDEQSELIGVASMLHDVGKIAVPDRILLKPGKLTLEEFEVVKTHTKVGYELLKGSQADLLREGAEIALSHHEWWDGSGYPLGHREEEIPLSGRIAAVSDVFDALTSRRPYRGSFPIRVAAERMQEERATHFDPGFLDVFMANLSSAAEIVDQYA